MSIWRDGSELPDAGHDIIMDYGDLSYELNRGGRYPADYEERPVRWTYLQDLIAAAERGEELTQHMRIIRGMTSPEEMNFSVQLENAMSTIDRVYCQTNAALQSGPTTPQERS